MRTASRPNFGASMAGSPVTIGLIAINVIVFLMLEVTGGSSDNINLYRWGAKYGPAIADGEWWRLVLPIFMHIGFLHLFTNSIGLLIFGSMAERFLGSLTYLSIYLVAGIVGNVASYVITPALGAGASGAVFGVIGAFGVFILLNRRLLGEYGRQALITVAVIIALNIVIGFTTAGIDNAAHVGGLITGALMAYLAAPRQRLVLTQGWGEIGPPRVAVSNSGQRLILVTLAVTTGIVFAVVGTWIKTTDYPYADVCKERFDYAFMDFSSGSAGQGRLCTAFLVPEA